MTFKDVALKNFKFNIKKYLAYFLCSSFCVTIFFMYSTVLFNTNMMKKVKEFGIDDMVKVLCFLIIVFSLFFISYVHTAFIKFKTKELGLFMVLGMDKKSMQRLIKIENKVIAGGSILMGLIAGVVFSRIFFMVVMKILDLPGIEYSLNYKNFIYTIAIFVAIFIFMGVVTKIRTNKLELTDLLKVKRKSQSSKRFKPIVGILGVLMIIISYVGLYLLRNSKAFVKAVSVEGVLVACIIMSGLGIYICICEFGGLLIQTSKNNKNKYYRNILSISQINYKFKQYRKVLFVVSMLSAVVVFFIGLVYGTYSTVLDNTNVKHPYDIMYVEKSNHNKLSNDKINEIAQKRNVAIKEKKSLKVIETSLKRKFKSDELDLWTDRQMVLSDKELSEFLGKKVDVQKGHVKVMRFSDKGKSLFEKGSVIKIINNKNKKSYDFVPDDDINEAVINQVGCKDYCSYYPVVVDIEDYNKLSKNYSAQDVLKINVFNFANWKNTEGVYKDLIEELKISNNLSNLNKNDIKVKELKEGVPHKYNQYKLTLKENTFMFFIMSFMGGLFFISVGVVLYFKVYSDIDEGKTIYNKLLKIGITDKEMKNVFSKQLRSIFFIPIVLGCMAGFLYIDFIVQNEAFDGKMRMSCLIVIGIYFILQTIFYLITKNKFVKEVVTC